METNALLGPEPEVEIDYPYSDGTPMAESTAHADAMVFVMMLLKRLRVLRGWEDVLLAMDLFLYFEQGVPAAVLAPDIMVIPGVTNPLDQRLSFQVWQENDRLPTVVFEFTSQSTFRYNLTEKRDKYERLGIPEYFLFDPLRQQIPEALRGFRLVNGRYVPIPLQPNGVMESRQLTVNLLVQGELLRLSEPNTGELISTDSELLEESEQQLEATTTRLEQTATRLEATTTRLKVTATQLESVSQEAEQLRRANETLRARLQAMGIDPDTL